ncbi:MAG: N-carbamoylsarcosine amidase [Alphaproteobacteria bacterium MarineAlpha2_Bin1]|nr:MAG: N-carbamoylsarcosine amidase [Alphaproteobacteria bacterium MarineAlpha2_Bin1]
MKKIWDNFLTKQDKEVFEKSGYGIKAGFGTRPVLLVIDINYNFLGDRPKPILESIEEWPNSCGEIGWNCIPTIINVIGKCRKKNIPIIYTTGEVRNDKWDRGSWAWKNKRTSSGKIKRNNNFDPNDIINDIKPESQDIIIKKLKPSGFYGTNLQSFLNLFGADTLLILGTTTSGCVRATAIDGFSANYKVCVIEDCCFDRSEASHAINLCDLNAKYADVIESDDVIKYLDKVDNNLFELPLGDKNN